MNKGISIALVGASGVVGTKIIQLLEKREFPVDKFIPLGNSTVGSSIKFKNKEYRVSSLKEFSTEKGQFIIFSAGSSIAEKYARKFVAEGCFVIDLFLFSFGNLTFNCFGNILQSNRLNFSAEKTKNIIFSRNFAISKPFSKIQNGI